MKNSGFMNCDVRPRKEGERKGDEVGMRLVREAVLWFEMRAKERMKERKVRGVMNS